MTRKRINLILIILLTILLILTVRTLDFENLSWSTNASTYQRLITMALMFIFAITHYRKQSND